MRRLLTIPLFVLLSCLVLPGFAAEVVPDAIKQPGTQPGEVSNFESPDKCDNCHGGYDSATYSNEPAFGWRGGAMGNAGRDPIFWATLAIAEQDFDGVGDLCIRCHSTGGWYAGRSAPTDGSGLQASDDDGVDCDTCHKVTNPDNSEHPGVMNAPFIANDSVTGEGYYGSGILSIWSGSDKLGPYHDAEARHQFMASQFHRSDMCGSCHDVSNPVVGDLAANHGTQQTADPVISSYDFPPLGQPNPGGPVEEKAAFNNPPYRYGIVERTFSEWKSGALDDMDVRNFPDLPPDLQAVSGALNMAYQSAMLAGGTYADGTVRTFTCQSCHMRPDVGEGCNKTVPTRPDLPKHDQSGGNYWMWPLIKYQDQRGTLRLGGGLTATQIAAMDAGQIRAQDQLRMAATLEVIGDTVKITNLTGHKLITGYPEGRRMWLNIKWYDGIGALVREDGAYGRIGVTVPNPAGGPDVEVESILDLSGTNTKIYEAHYAMTQDWAALLLSLGYDPGMPLSFDRATHAADYRLSDLSAGTVPHGSYHDTFHFVLNNKVSKDNRIPPYGFDYETARQRNALPAPDTQYREDTNVNTYDYWDIVPLDVPAGATGAEITLYYQGTSWEYIQFLWLANNQQNAFLGDEGVNMLDAWINADPQAPMVPPFVMATAIWGDICDPSEPSEATCNDTLDNDCDGLPDTDDPDCQCTPVPEVCDDGSDNDCDGLVDGEDPDCQMACSSYTTKETCNAAPSCQWQGSPKSGSCGDACAPTEQTELTCNDGLDNDCDGNADCADIDCAGTPECPAVDCSVYSTRNLCNAQATCRWDSKGKVCVNR
jgi:hypothetical protein